MYVPDMAHYVCNTSLLSENHTLGRLYVDIVMFSVKNQRCCQDET